MGINEARQQGAALQIHVAGLRACMGHHLSCGSNSNNASARDSDCLGAGLGGLHREDGSSRKDQVGGFGHQGRTGSIPTG